MPLVHLVAFKYAKTNRIPQLLIRLFGVPHATHTNNRITYLMHYYHEIKYQQYTPPSPIHGEELATINTTHLFRHHARTYLFRHDAQPKHNQASLRVKSALRGDCQCQRQVSGHDHVAYTPNVGSPNIKKNIKHVKRTKP